MAKSYYAILGISSSAKADEIKAAYRRLIKEFHPDNYSGGSNIFQQIQEAYSVLNDNQERRQYDQNLINARARVPLSHKFSPEPEHLIPERQSAYIDDISLVRSFHTFTPSFEEIFDWLWNNFSTLNYPKSGWVQNLTIEVPLTKEQVLSGGNARVMVPVRAICKICRGYGNVGPYECTRCAGEGAIVGEVPILVAFPPGLKKNHTVMIPLDRYGIRNLHLIVLFCLTDIY
ncbi:MAG: DnaJ domain-containing protein [Smithella sp.]